jgi:hypothetical protein
VSRAIQQFPSAPAASAKLNFADAGLGFTYVDFNAIDFDGDTPLQGYQARRLNIRGDWLYVDPSSTGGCQADLFSRQKDTWLPSVLLTPGVVIRVPFNNVAVFYNPQIYSSLRVQPGVLGVSVPYQSPGLRLWYGIGDCPFTPATETRGCGWTGLGVTSNISPVNWSIGYGVTDGTVIRRAMCGSSKNQAVGETCRPLVYGYWQTVQGENIGYAMPDTLQIQGNPGGGAGTFVYAYAGWRDLVVPKYAANFVMYTAETGNAVTNLFGATVGSMHLG